MGDTDFSAQIARLAAIDPNPDAVFVSAIPSEAGLSVKQIREQGLNFKIISGDGFDTQLVSTFPAPNSPTTSISPPTLISATTAPK